MQSDLLFMRYKDDFQEFFEDLDATVLGNNNFFLSGTSRVPNDKVVVISLNLENEGMGFSKWKG